MGVAGLLGVEMKEFLVVVRREEVCHLGQGTVVGLLALSILASIVGESFSEEEVRGFGEDFSGTCGGDRSGEAESFRYEGVVTAGFQEGDVAGVGSHAFCEVGGLLS